MLLLMTSFMMAVASATSSTTTSTTTMAFGSVSTKAMNRQWNREIRRTDEERMWSLPQRPVISTVPPRHRSLHEMTKTTQQLRSTRLMLGKNSDDNRNQSTIDVDGMTTAPYIFTFIFFLCVWNFTIPTEFRRARICSEQQVIDYPNSNCKTWSQYTTGIQDHYRNGGTLFKFDFSVDRENNIWITGPQEILE